VSILLLEAFALGVDGGGSFPCVIATLASAGAVSPGSSDESYKTAEGDVFGSSLTHEPYVPEGHVQTQTAQPVYFTPLGNGSQVSSIFTVPEESLSGSGSDEGLMGLENSGYESPPPANERNAELRDERRYRIVLAHEFHPSCECPSFFLCIGDMTFNGWIGTVTLPLWTPTLVSLGDVGYLAKPSGTFVKLFSAFDPVGSSEGAVKGMPPVSGYGNVTQGQQKQDKRNIAQKGLDAISGLLTFKSKVDGPVSYVVFPSFLLSFGKANVLGLGDVGRM
jgi:hypothetical protein